MKRLSCARLLALLGIAGFLLCITGCLEEKETLTVYPSGAGKIHVYQKFGDQLSQMVLSLAPSPDKKQSTIESSLYTDLGKWQGITAWSPVTATIESGHIMYEATGYFDDVTAVKKVDGENVQSMVWTSTPDGGFKLVWSGGNSKKQQPLEEVSDEQQQQMDGMMEMFKGLRLERTAVLPGTVASCTGCTEHKDRGASFVVTGDEVVKVFAMQKDYRQRIASKKMTSQQANAEFSEKTKVFSEDLTITSAPGSASGEFEQFKKDYQKAKTDYAASGLADKISHGGK